MSVLRPLLPRRLSASWSKSADASNFAWNYWRRSSSCNSACWDHLRLNFFPSSTIQDNDFRRSGTHGVFQIRAHSLYHQPHSSNINPQIGSCPWNVAKVAAMPEITLRGGSSRWMSGSSGRSQAGFSTMLHSTSAHSEKESKAEAQKDSEMASLPASQKAKILFKKYGTVFVGTYLGVYFTTLLTFFVSLDFGLLDPEYLSQVFKVSTDLACETADIIGPTGTGASMNEAASAYAEEVTHEITKDRRTLVDIISGYLESWEWSSKYAEKLSENPHLANLAVAWFMVKFTEPIRLAAAVILTPKVARMLGRKEVEAPFKKSG